MARQIHNSSTAPKSAPSGDWLKPAGTGFALLLFLVAISLLSKRLNAAPGPQAHSDFITGMVLLGGAAGLIGVVWGWFDPIPPRAAMRPGVFYSIAAALTVFIGVFILGCGMHQIAGFDHSIVVDFGWRLFSGQRAYEDFPCTVPIAFPLGAKFAFQWFGVYWRSLIEMTALYSMAAFVWSLMLLAQLFGRNWTTLLWAMAVQVFSPMLASFWWYSPISAVGGVLYLLSAAYWMRCPDKKSAVVSYGAALLLLATMKQNIAGVLILGISAVLFLSPRHRWKVIGVSLVSFALFLVLLSINHMSFPSLLAAYLGIASRGASLVPFLIDLNPFEKRMAMVMLASVLWLALLTLSQGRGSLRSLLPWIPVLAMLGGFYWFLANLEQKAIGEASLYLPVFMALWLGRKSLCRPNPWIPIVALLGGLYTFTTNSEQKLVDLPPVLLAAILLAAELSSPVVAGEGSVFRMPVWWNRYFALVCLVLGAGGLAQGFARDRVYSAGPMQFFEYDGSKHTLSDGFFKGVRCGDIFVEVLNEVGEVLRREPSSPVWFGPRMQWGYAAFAKPSPLHEPVIWEPLTMFDKTREKFYFDQFLQSRRPLIILFKNDLAHYSQDEVQRIVQQYSVDQSFPLLTVLRLKQ